MVRVTGRSISHFFVTSKETRVDSLSSFHLDLCITTLQFIWTEALDLALPLRRIYVCMPWRALCFTTLSPTFKFRGWSWARKSRSVVCREVLTILVELWWTKLFRVLLEQVTGSISSRRSFIAWFVQLGVCQLNGIRSMSCYVCTRTSLRPLN